MTDVPPRRSTRYRAPAIGALVALLAVAGIVGVLDAPVEPARTPLDPLLPDLVMTPILEVEGSFDDDNVPMLRFAATIANIGQGDFLAHARRSWPWTDDWRVVQRTTERSGPASERPTGASLVFGGDSHDHWHIRDMESHRLEDLETGEVVGQVLKQGFCAYDTEPYAAAVPGAPAEARYLETQCGTRLDTELRLGISVGWEDVYPWDMLEQRVSLAGVADGRYRIHEVADPLDQFVELDETNNETWVDIELKVIGGIPEVRVIGHAPVERPDTGVVAGWR